MVHGDEGQERHQTPSDTSRDLGEPGKGVAHRRSGTRGRSTATAPRGAALAARRPAVPVLGTDGARERWRRDMGRAAGHEMGVHLGGKFREVASRCQKF